MSAAEPVSIASILETSDTIIPELTDEEERELPQHL